MSSGRGGCGLKSNGLSRTTERARGTKTPRANGSRTHAGAGWFGELLAGKPASGGESLCHLRGSRGAELCRNPALGGECHARSDSSGPSVGGLVLLRKKKPRTRNQSIYIHWLLFYCFFGMLFCFVVIIIAMIMITIMRFFILIIVFITQPLAGHFVDSVSQPL